jgi:3-oxoacyl-(acyl-carrier-protein) synthase
MSAEVYVTGVGIISPAGLTAPASWQALLRGDRCTAICPELSAAMGLPIAVGLVHGFAAPAGFESRDRMCQMAVAASLEAIGGDVERFRSSLGPLRLGISVGTSKGGIQQFAQFASTELGVAWGPHADPMSPKLPARVFEKGAPPRREARGGGLMNSRPSSISSVPHPVLRNGVGHPGPSQTRSKIFDIPPDSAARAIAELLSAPALMHATVAACSTGTLSVIRGIQMIERDEADVVLCGAADASLHPLWLAAFAQMGTLASPHPELGPAFACQPFDCNRRGFVVGEGAGILMLESPRAIDRRGSTSIARLAGYGCATDPAGLTQLGARGEVLAYAIRLACARAGVRPADIACIHAHGTGTVSNDLAEIRGIHDVLGECAIETAVVSAKGAVGHLLGAAGAVELALACLCRRESFGNLTLMDPDPQLDPVLLPKERFRLDPGPILKTSLGFGGHTAAVLIV